MSWRDLKQELDLWGDSGRTATLWWRDDDAGKRCPALDRLLGISRGTGLPVVLSVVPERLEEGLPEDIRGLPARVLQHGCRHINRAPPDAKKCELIADAATEAGLAGGLARLSACFQDAFLPVLVPPWNRIDAALVPRLAEIGYRGLSRAKPRQARTIEGLHQVNAHIDIIGWRSGRGFRGEPETLAAAVAHLRARRTGEVDADEPTGLLTHHLDHDEGCWAFIDRFLSETHDHPAVRWLDGGEVFVA